ncbi:MAG: hypothetical protein WD830_08970 [Chloroflexota bacterium]
MDQQQPQWSPPPQQPAGWGGPGYGGPPPRPTGVTLASIYLIVMGVLTSLVGGCATIGGAAFGQIGSGTTNSGPFGAFGAILAGIGIFILILGILGIVAGAGALGGKGWGRWIGIIISVIFAILLILGGITSFTAPDGATSGITTLVIGVLYALTAWALIQASAYFAARR